MIAQYLKISFIKLLKQWRNGAMEEQISRLCWNINCWPIKGDNTEMQNWGCRGQNVERVPNLKMSQSLSSSPPSSAPSSAPSSLSSSSSSSWRWSPRTRPLQRPRPAPSPRRLQRTASPQARPGTLTWLWWWIWFETMTMIMMMINDYWHHKCCLVIQLLELVIPTAAATAAL